MPPISSFDGIVIRMYSEEHGPPHFHAIYAEHEAVIGITELQVTRGSLPGRRLARVLRVLRWAVDHQAELMDNWELCRRLEPPKPAVPWRVVRVEPLPETRLHVTFADGTTGEVDLGGFLRSTRVRGTRFEQLRSREEFQRVRTEFGAVTWPNGADLAPDAMYDAIRTHGRCVYEGEQMAHPTTL